MGCSPSTLMRHSDDAISTNTNNDNHTDTLHYEKPKNKTFCCFRKLYPPYMCHGCQYQKRTESNSGRDGSIGVADTVAGANNSNCESGNGNDSDSESVTSPHNSTVMSGDDSCNHTLLSRLQSKDGGDCDRTCCTKKDAVITLGTFGTLTQAVIKVAKGNIGSVPSTSSDAPRRKSSSIFHEDDEDNEDDLSDDCTSMDGKESFILAPHIDLKALLVSQKMDNTFRTVRQACTRNDIDVVVASKESVFHTINKPNKDIHIFMIDARNNNILDAESIIKSIRDVQEYHYTTIIAVVKKNYYKKADFVHALLNAGVNRCMTETSNLALCCEEIKQVIFSVVRLNNFLSTQELFHTTLNRVKAGILVTNSRLQMQYVNQAGEQMLNTSFQKDLSNKLIEEIFVSDITPIKQLCQSKTLEEYESRLIVKRNNLEGLLLQIHMVPTACIGKQPTHYIFELNPPSQNENFSNSASSKDVYSTPSHASRRLSVDRRSITSDFLRRASLAKIATLEVPISKIIGVLSQIQQHLSPEESYLIDTVMEILRRDTICNPPPKDIRTEDPTTKCLLGALLVSPNVLSGRRTSSDSVLRISRNSNFQSVVHENMTIETKSIADLLEDSLDWEFDIFKFETITNKQPLLYLGLDMFKRFNVFSTLNVEESICRNWLMIIESHYHDDNPYHNSTHAADVMQATGVFLSQLAVKDGRLDPVDEACALICAAAHDIDHPGRSSAFLCNSDSHLAILYNDLSVLESHHAALTFKLTLSDESVNVFKNLDKDLYKYMRTTIVDMILATEMTKHFDHLAKFVSVFGKDNEPYHSDEQEIIDTTEESAILVRRMLIKVADVSNPVRPVPLCVEWARRIAEEYFAQTDEEKNKNLPIVMPMFDRGTCSIPKSQIGFIEYIISDMMHAWDNFVNMPELITYLQATYDLWKTYEKQGIHTLEDAKDKNVALKKKKKIKK